MKDITEKPLEEVEKEFSEREKEIIDILVNNCDNLDDTTIRTHIKMIQVGRKIVETRRLIEKVNSIL